MADNFFDDQCEYAKPFGKQSSKWSRMSPVSMENIALFVPARFNY
jgi:hypothetical protein